MRTRSNKSTTPPAKPPAKKKNKDDDSVDCGVWPECREMLRELSQYSAQKKNKLFSSQQDPSLKSIGAEVSWGEEEENTCPGRKKAPPAPAPAPSQTSAAPTRRIQLAPEEDAAAAATKKPRRVSLDQADKTTPATTATPAANRRRTSTIRNPYTNNKKKRTTNVSAINKKKKAAAAAAAKNKEKKTNALALVAPAVAVAAAATAATATVAECGAEQAKLEYAKKLISNPNAFNTLGSDEYATAESNSKGYASKRQGCLKRFVQTILEATNPETNSPGDSVMYEMFTKKVPMSDGLTEDYLFYRNVAGKKDALKKTLMNQALMIWTLNIKNTKTGEPLDTNTHSVYVRVLFSAFHEKGIKFNEADFKGKGSFLSAVKLDFNKKRAVDPTLGTKRNKASFDEYGDAKFSSLLQTGVYKPYSDMKDLLKILTMELGRQFGLRGRDEIVFLEWSFMKLGSFSHGKMESNRYVIIAPGGGFDKGNQLSLHNPTVSEMFPMVVEDKTNPYCIVKLIFFYRQRCHPEQKRFLCYVNEHRHKDSPYYFKSFVPVGQDAVRKWVREVAQAAGYKDADKFTPHDNRHRCCTVLASDVNVPEKLKMNHLRHKSAKSSQVYDHVTSKTQQRVQNVLHAGFNYTKQKTQAASLPSRKKMSEQKQIVAEPSTDKNVLSSSPGTELKVELLAELKKASAVAAKKRKADEAVESSSSLVDRDTDKKHRRLNDLEKDLDEAKKSIAMLTSELQEKKLAIGIREGKDEFMQKELEWEKEKTASLEKKLESAANELKLQQQLIATLQSSLRQQQSSCCFM